MISVVRHTVIKKVAGEFHGQGDVKWIVIRPVWEVASKGEEDGRRPPTQWAGYPPNGRKAVWAVARPQGVEGSGMAGPVETLGSLWIPPSRTGLIVIRRSLWGHNDMPLGINLDQWNIFCHVM
jgi:hypothetical protein